jgi:hypothetical protein
MGATFAHTAANFNPAYGLTNRADMKRLQVDDENGSKGSSRAGNILTAHSEMSVMFHASSTSRNDLPLSVPAEVHHIQTLFEPDESSQQAAPRAVGRLAFRQRLPVCSWRAGFVRCSGVLAGPLRTFEMRRGVLGSLFD